MTANGSQTPPHAPNGNGHHARGAWGNIAAESFGLGMAELVCMAVSLGVVAVADKAVPGALDSISKIGGKIIEPYLLDPAEKTIKALCKLEECQPDMAKSRQERAEKLFRTFVIFDAAFLASLVAKIATRKGMNHVLKIGTPLQNTGKAWTDFYHNFIKPDKHDSKVILWDEGVHIGSMLLVNMGAAKQSDTILHATSNVLQKTVGMDKKQADDVASMAVIWELPNLLGFMAGIGAITHGELARRKT